MNRLVNDFHFPYVMACALTVCSYWRKILSDSGARQLASMSSHMVRLFHFIRDAGITRIDIMTRLANESFQDTPSIWFLYVIVLSVLQFVFSFLDCTYSCSKFALHIFAKLSSAGAISIEA